MAEAVRTNSNASANLKKGEFGYPAGHLGHLTQNEEAALLDFKRLLVEKKLLKEDNGEGEGTDVDDVTLLRFLRARRFVPKDALQQFADTQKWRETNEIDNLYMNIDVDEFNETWKLYPQWTGRRDKRGLPVYVYEVAPLNSKRMAEYAKKAEKTTVLDSKRNHSSPSDNGAIPPKLYRLFALYENLVHFAMPMCTALRDRPSPRTPISQANNIVDISKVGLKQFWNLRTHMQDASVLATAHYPETLDRIFIVGAPGFFPTVWEWIKRWFDPITVSKIFILSEAQAFKTLSAFIDPENIPQKYGGTLPFEFGGGPILDPYIVERLDFTQSDQKELPRGPLRWEAPSASKDNREWRLRAVGSVDGKKRRDVIATLRLDPIPPPDAKDTISEEAPDRSIDFATSAVKVNPRASYTSSNPPSPTALKHAMGDISHDEKVNEEAIIDEPDEKGEDAGAAGIAGATAAVESLKVSEKTANGSAVVAATPASNGSAEGDSAKLPPFATRPGDVPLDATAMPLPETKTAE